jgi:hypothetical protein
MPVQPEDTSQDANSGRRGRPSVRVRYRTGRTGPRAWSARIEVRTLQRGTDATTRSRIPTVGSRWTESRESLSVGEKRLSRADKMHTTRFGEQSGRAGRKGKTPWCHVSVINGATSVWSAGALACLPVPTRHGGLSPLCRAEDRPSQARPPTCPDFAVSGGCVPRTHKTGWAGTCPRAP